MATTECDSLPVQSKYHPCPAKETSIPISKKCVRCKKIKLATEFHTYIPNNPNHSIRLQSWCQECARKRVTNATRLRESGLTDIEYQKMLDAQNGVCKICRRSSSKTLHADHCHKTKKNRGLLCDKCNRGIGHFNDNPALLQAAIEYLQEASNGTL